MALPCMTQGTDQQEEYQQRRNGLQGTYKNISQNGNAGCLRHDQSQDHTNDQTTYDTQDQADAVPLFK